jgi:general L-amino acid transport system substrate-binding protein
MKLAGTKFMIGGLVAAIAFAAIPAHAGKTLDAIKARGQVVCGVNTGLAGFSQADSAGAWSGLDVDRCGGNARRRQ